MKYAVCCCVGAGTRLKTTNELNTFLESQLLKRIKIFLSKGGRGHLQLYPVISIEYDVMLCTV